jgi:sulfotransferase famil protein
MLLRKNGELGESQLPIIIFGSKEPLSYILNPKAACTLALHFLFFANHNYRYFDVARIHFSTLALHRLVSPELDPGALKTFFGLSPESFSIVRDPLRRFISSFHEKVLMGGDPGYANFRDLLTSVHGIDLSPEANPAQSCLVFARWLASVKDLRSFDAHFRPQYLNLSIGGGFDIGTILQLEDKTSLFAFFAKWIGDEKAKWFLSLRFNVQTYGVDDFVTKELKDLVREIYAEDYKLFYSSTGRTEAARSVA